MISKMLQKRYIKVKVIESEGAKYIALASAKEQYWPEVLQNIQAYITQGGSCWLLEKNSSLNKRFSFVHILE